MATFRIKSNVTQHHKWQSKWFFVHCVSLNLLYIYIYSWISVWQSHTCKAKRRKKKSFAAGSDVQLWQHRNKNEIKNCSFNSHNPCNIFKPLTRLKFINYSWQCDIWLSLFPFIFYFCTTISSRNHSGHRWKKRYFSSLNH